MKLLKNKRFWFGAVLIVLHVLLVLRMFPPSIPASGDLLFKGDLSRYFASMAGVDGVDGMHGYDPHFMAGYPVGLWNSMGKKAYELACLAVPGASLPVLLYVVTVMFAVSAPLIIWCSLLPFVRNARKRLIGLLLILALWHLDSHVSGFWDFGNVFFPTAACLALSGYAFAHMAASGRKWILNGLAFGIVSGIAVYCHPTMALTCVFGGLAALISGTAKGMSRWLWLPLSALCAALLLAPWLVSLLGTLGDYAPLRYEGFQGTPKHFVMDVFSDRMFRRHFDRNAFLHLMVIGGMLGLWAASRKGEAEANADRRWLIGISGIGFACLVVTYSFSLVPALKQTQPYRFIVPAMMALIPATVLGMEHVWKVFREGSAGVRAALLAFAILVMPAFSAYLLDQLEKEPATGVPEHYRTAFARVKELDIEGRILVENISLGHLLPYHTGVAVVGGLSAEAFTKHGAVGVDYKGKVFGKSPSEWEIGDFATHLKSYGVEYLFLSSKDWRDYVASNPSHFELVAGLPSGNIYAFAGFDGLAVDGKARIEADYNRISVSNISSRELILRYHYSPQFSASEEVKLEPVSVLSDPVPFIRCIIPEGVNAFTVDYSR